MEFLNNPLLIEVKKVSIPLHCRYLDVFILPSSYVSIVRNMWPGLSEHMRREQQWPDHLLARTAEHCVNLVIDNRLAKERQLVRKVSVTIQSERILTPSDPGIGILITSRGGALSAHSYLLAFQGFLYNP